ncbi:hypothetical protein LEM8419_01687 [Neolewinella maritima]|uniref:Calcineurin-like phosphoesterase domain-containing protein n=1 Tax=Neolewinella maritima TaxID=1383882 RepID=A0ABM9B0V4_9BACT|nr:metallophosphoesterase [Neolewinella maritima]CAH1000534.1 hypothetical protein LEM8419_01687 [Neolewinella maritima]
MLPLLASLALALSADTLPLPDGPYLFYEDDGVVARWVDTEQRTADELVYTPENYAALPRFTSFRPELVDVSRAFEQQSIMHYEGIDKVIALSDIHGQFDTGRELLLANGVINTANDWSFGTGHLVVVGDIFDRGDQVTETLWLIHNLQVQAERAGGMVHFLLGNHETMVLEGDDRYLHKKYRVTTSLMGKFYRELYGPNTYLGRWLRSLPLAVEIDKTVFIHGGLSRQMVREVSSITKLNELYHTYLIDADDMDDVVSGSNRMDLLHGRLGPLWYRGYFTKGTFSARDLGYVLRKLDAKRIVVGHTSFTAIQGFYDNRVIAVDSSIKFGSAGEVLILDQGTPYRGTLKGLRIPLITAGTK